MKSAVVIPTYNRKTLVTEAIRSALDQSEACEVVVVDDGSQDGTIEHLVNEFALREIAGARYGERLHVVAIPNSERGAARNRGARWAIDRLGAEWVLFLDADDKLLPGAVRRFHETGHAHAVAWRAEYTPWDGAEFRASHRFPRRPGDLKLKILEGRLGGLGSTWIRSSAFLACGGFSEDRRMSGSEDYDFLCRLAFQGPIFSLPYLSTLYRHHPGNTGAAAASRSADLAIASVSRFVQLNRSTGSAATIRCVRRFGFICRLGSAVSRNEFAAALRTLPDSLEFVPGIFFDSRFLRILASWAKRLLTP